MQMIWRPFLQTSKIALDISKQWKTYFEVIFDPESWASHINIRDFLASIQENLKNTCDITFNKLWRQSIVYWARAYVLLNLYAYITKRYLQKLKNLRTYITPTGCLSASPQSFFQNSSYASENVFRSKLTTQTSGRCCMSRSIGTCMFFFDSKKTSIASSYLAC